MGSQMRLKTSRTSVPTMLRQPIRQPPRFMVTREIGTVITFNRRVSVKMVKLIHMLHCILPNRSSVMVVDSLWIASLDMASVAAVAFAPMTAFALARPWP